MDTLAGKVAVVTGAGQGIGRGVALVLAERGVNCAQDFGFGPVLQLDLDDLARTWASGFLGTLLMMRACHPHLAGGGAVVNVGSGVAHAPVPGVAGYAAVKAAITCLSRSAAVELAGDGIRVNTIVPFALTPSVQAVLDASPEYREAALSPVPLARIGDPWTDIGRAVAFLCGPDAGYVTGTVLSVDGGETYLR